MTLDTLASVFRTGMAKRGYLDWLRPRWSLWIGLLDLSLVCGIEIITLFLYSLSSNRSRLNTSVTTQLYR